jgi:hypothetical protein
MTQPLISLLIAILIFGTIAWVMWIICVKFFPEFPPARWICGVVLLIILLLYISGQLGSGPALGPLHR